MQEQDLSYRILGMFGVGGQVKRSDGSFVLLSDWLKDNPKALGDEVASKWDSTLPYLFKILSVRTALSIQAHPDKKLAEQLHEDRPNVYKDDNHKPEMALAITPFEAMCGFENGPELKEALTSVPELAHLVGEENVQALCKGVCHHRRRHRHHPPFIYIYI